MTGEKIKKRKEKEILGDGTPKGSKTHRICPLFVQSELK